MKRQKLLTSEELEKRKNMKFFKLLNDEVFWIKFYSVCLKPSRISNFREYRTKFLLPRKKTLTDFIEQDYRLLTGDTRETSEIILDLLSVSIEVGEDIKQTSTNFQEVI